VTTPAPQPDPLRPRVRLISAARTPDDGLVESYRRLADVFHDVHSEQSPDALLERIADTLAALIPYDDMHIYEADEAKRELTPVLARSRWAKEVMSETFPFGVGITGWACTHREPVLSTRRTSIRASASCRVRRSNRRRSWSCRSWHAAS
jgi:hypothetical protein